MLIGAKQSCAASRPPSFVTVHNNLVMGAVDGSTDSELCALSLPPGSSLGPASKASSSSGYSVSSSADSLTDVENLKTLISKAEAAQQVYSRYTQQQVDAIFKAASNAASAARIELAVQAVEDTGKHNALAAGSTSCLDMTFSCAAVTRPHGVDPISTSRAKLSV